MTRIASISSLVVLLGLATSAHAVELVTNGSFENPAHDSSWNSTNPDGDYLLGSIPGWTSTGVSGVWQPVAGMFNSIPDGTQLGFTGNGAAGTLTQDLPWTIGADDNIVVTFEFGDRANLASKYGITSKGTLTLWTTGTHQFIASSEYSTPGTTGDWWSGGFGLNSSNLSTFVGQGITLELSTPAGYQASWDKVSVEAVPEPASMIALGLGVVGLISRRKKN